jgi:hypothetical protein
VRLCPCDRLAELVVVLLSSPVCYSNNWGNWKKSDFVFFWMFLGIIC